MVPDDLWGRIEPLLPVRQRRPSHPGRLPLDDHGCLQGILFVLHTGIQWERLADRPWFDGPSRPSTYRMRLSLTL